MILDEGSAIAMPTGTLEEAKAHLEELIAQLQPGEELIITRDQEPVARLTGAAEPARAPCFFLPGAGILVGAGSIKGVPP